ncbi:MAG: hypothetical protein ACPGJV_03800 [Bacteriovoracaceae bacterium]
MIKIASLMALLVSTQTIADDQVILPSRPANAQHCLQELIDQHGAHLKDDPYLELAIIEPNQVNRQSHAAGKCIETHRTRSVIILNKETLKSHGIEAKADHTYIANFRHQKSYFIAEIPNSGLIQRSLYQFEPFDPLTGENGNGGEFPVQIGHGQTRFDFHQGKTVSLYDQILKTEEEQSPLHQIDGIVFSYYVADIIGNSQYDPKAGMADQYGSVYVLMSREDAFKHYKSQNKPVEQTVLNFTEQEAHDALSFYFQISNDTQFKEYYNGYSRSCLTESLKGVAAGKGETFEMKAVNELELLTQQEVAAHKTAEQANVQKKKRNLTYEYLKGIDAIRFYDEATGSRGADAVTNFEQESLY